MWLFFLRHSYPFLPYQMDRTCGSHSSLRRSGTQLFKKTTHIERTPHGTLCCWQLYQPTQTVCRERKKNHITKRHGLEWHLLWEKYACHRLHMCSHCSCCYQFISLGNSCWQKLAVSFSSAELHADKHTYHVRHSCVWCTCLHCRWVITLE